MKGSTKLRLLGVLLGISAALMVGAGIALADDPAPPAGAPAKPGSHNYYWVAENKYLLHNTRLQDCLLCHSQQGGWSFNAYGLAVLDGLDGVLGNSAPPTTEIGNGTTYTQNATAIDEALALAGIPDSDGDKVGWYRGTTAPAIGSNNYELWSLTFPGNASDNVTDIPGPATTATVHGGYGETPDACARCHRTHTAKDKKLLSQDQYGLCMSCHDGSGATTDVHDGDYAGGGLKGGGFVRAFQSTDLHSAAADHGVTSRHIVDGGTGTMWGSGALNSGPGQANVAIQCGDCHDPHNPAWTPDDGTTTVTQYRMLKLASPSADYQLYYSPITRLAVPAIPKDQTGWTDSYLQTYDATTHRPVTTYQPNDRLGQFCAQCHARYQTGSSTSHMNADMVENRSTGDSIFAYQHATREANCERSSCHVGTTYTRPRCLDCHVSHGTSATMGAFSGAVEYPGAQPVNLGNARSSLLRVNNRGVCTQCHEK